MGVKVVDASALAAVLYSEPESEAVCADIGQDAMAAPTLIEYEMGQCLPEQMPTLPSACPPVSIVVTGDG